VTTFVGGASDVGSIPRAYLRRRRAGCGGTVGPSGPEPSGSSWSMNQLSNLPVNPQTAQPRMCCRRSPISNKTWAWRSLVRVPVGNFTKLSFFPYWNVVRKGRRRGDSERTGLRVFPVRTDRPSPARRRQAALDRPGHSRPLRGRPGCLTVLESSQTRPGPGQT
jgi:hypothetical protein